MLTSYLFCKSFLPRNFPAMTVFLELGTLLHYVLSYLCVASAIRIHKYDHALSNVCKVCTYSDQIQDIKLIVIMNHHYKLIIRPLWLQVVFVLVTPFYWRREEMNVSLVISALPIWLIEMVKQYYHIIVNGQQLC